MVTSVVAFVVSVTTQEMHVLGILQVTHGRVQVRQCNTARIHGRVSCPCWLLPKIFQKLKFSS